ncbi:MAG: hypothetical protein DRI81_20535 [Chloroflexi bacterium]|nr:MAG: hypothetical protein DRI81_20535 [Chloroflexota bacterium]RLG37686.1 MAG: hypothetical protein DRN91_04750 [Candidatus Alkanophagales archaeon]
MKIDMTQKLTNFDGTIHMLAERACPACGRPADEQIATLRAICTRALIATYRDEAQKGEPTPQEKFNRYQLAQKLQQSDVVDLKAEEIAKLKALVGKMWGPIQVGQAWNMLDPDAREFEDA